jgi:hypothetical protein
MYKYRFLIKVNASQTAHTFVWADNDIDAKLLAEAQYGVGSVLHFTQVDN